MENSRNQKNQNNRRGRRRPGGQRGSQEDSDLDDDNQIVERRGDLSQLGERGLNLYIRGQQALQRDHQNEQMQLRPTNSQLFQQSQGPSLTSSRDRQPNPRSHNEQGRHSPQSSSSEILKSEEENVENED